MDQWNALTYMAIERMLFDQDFLLRRMMAVASDPRTPPQTDRVLRKAWDLGLDAARELHDEKERLERAKVAFDRREVA